VTIGLALVQVVASIWLMVSQVLWGRRKRVPTPSSARKKDMESPALRLSPTLQSPSSRQFNQEAPSPSLPDRGGHVSSVAIHDTSFYLHDEPALDDERMATFQEQPLRRNESQHAAESMSTMRHSADFERRTDSFAFSHSASSRGKLELRGAMPEAPAASKVRRCASAHCFSLEQV